MKKRNKIIYWITTGLLAFGMTAQGLAQITFAKGYVDMINVHLGYPLYFLTIIGIWKLFGVIVILVPGFALVKEWAYAGFFFVMSGALISHLSAGDSIKDILPSLFLLILIAASWYYRPADRKLIFHSEITKS